MGFLYGFIKMKYEQGLYPSSQAVHKESEAQGRNHLNVKTSLIDWVSGTRNTPSQENDVNLQISNFTM